MQVDTPTPPEPFQAALAKEPSWQRRLGPMFWKIIQERSPSEYAGKIGEGIDEGKFTADQALYFPMSQRMDRHLESMPHKASNGVDNPRDERLKEWFSACVDCGADPLAVVKGLGANASGAFTRLIQMRAYATLAWWRDRGVEEQFEGPLVLNRERTTLATLAFLQGKIEAIDRLLPGSKLTHVGTLWGAVWGHQSVDRCNELIRYLQKLESPPANALWSVCGAKLNKKNIASVMAAMRTLLDAGCRADATPEGQLPALGVVVERMTSPGAERVVEFLLAHGADPMEKAPMGPINGSKPREVVPMVEVALAFLLRCSTSSHLRDAIWACFERMARACDRNAVRALYPPERQSQILEEISADHAARSMPFGITLRHDPQMEVSKLQALWLEICAEPATNAPRSAMRL